MKDGLVGRKDNLEGEFVLSTLGSGLACPCFWQLFVLRCSLCIGSDASAANLSLDKLCDKVTTGP